MRAPLVVVPMCSPSVYTSRYSEPDKIAFGLDHEDAWPVPYWTVDAAFATMILLLGVVDEGLGALFFGRDGAAYARVTATFSVPEGWRPIGFVTLGWPAPGFGPAGLGGPTPAGRESEVVHRGQWGR